MEARGGPSMYGPPTLLHCKNNGFCNISYAMEAPWRLVEARLCTSLHRFCIVKTIKKQAFCTIEALRDSGLYNIKLGSPRASTDRRGCQPMHLEF